MSSFRATIRWATDRQRYHIEDLEAPDLLSALERLRTAIPAEVAAHADLLELRIQPRPEERERADG